MRTNNSVTISIPPAMVEELERVRKSENLTRSELVREALNAYFRSRVASVKPTKAEIAAIRTGRAEIERGQYVTLAQLHDELDSPDRKARARRPSIAFR